MVPSIMSEYALPAADAAVLTQIPGCEMIDLILPDLNGLLRGKRVTRDALGKIYQSACACRCR
jgi:glutamine synthetase